MNKIDAEIIRVMTIMDEHGYAFCNHVDYNFANQFVMVETVNDGRIISWVWAVPNRDHFKAVLKWFCAKTKFSAVTAYAADRKRIPTFFTAEDVERNYSEYFG